MLSISRKRVRRIAVYGIVLAPYASSMFYFEHGEPRIGYWVAVLGVILIELLAYNEKYGDEPLYNQRRLKP